MIEDGVAVRNSKSRGGFLALSKFRGGNFVEKIEQLVVLEGAWMIFKPLFNSGADIVAGAGLDYLRAFGEDFCIASYAGSDDGDVPGEAVFGVFTSDDDKLAFVGPLLRADRRLHKMPAVARPVGAKPFLLGIGKQG